MLDNRLGCASACPVVVLDLTCVRGTQGEIEWGGRALALRLSPSPAHSLRRQCELAVGFVCHGSGGLEDLRNGGGGWNLGIDVGCAALALGGAGAVFITC